MEIHASCVLDLASVQALNRYLMFKKHDPRKRMIFWNIVYGILFCILAAEAFLWGWDSQLVRMLLILLGVEVFMLFFYFGIPRLQYRAMSQMQGTVNRYCFRDEEIVASSQGAAYSGEGRIPYSMLVRAAETSRYFFLWQTKNQVYIVDKRTITDGDPAWIRGKLQGLLGKKYVLCKY